MWTATIEAQTNEAKKSLQAINDMWIYEKMIGHHWLIKDCWPVWDTNLQKNNQSNKNKMEKIGWRNFDQQ